MILIINVLGLTFIHDKILFCHANIYKIYKLKYLRCLIRLHSFYYKFNNYIYF